MSKSKKSKKDEVFKVDLPDKKVGFGEFLKLVAIPDHKQTSKKKAPLRLEDIPKKKKK